jgi:hypothetical protein
MGVLLKLKNTLSIITYAESSFNLTRVVFDSHAALRISKHFYSTQSKERAIGVLRILQDSVKRRFKKSLNRVFILGYLRKSMNYSSLSFIRVKMIFVIAIL